MIKAPAFLLLSLALGGCALAPQASLTPDPAFRPSRYAWDGAGENPNQPRSGASSASAVRVASERAVAQTDGRFSSTPRRRAQDGTEADDQDARVNRALVICHGCIAPPPAPREEARLAKAAD